MVFTSFLTAINLGLYGIVLKKSSAKIRLFFFYLTCLFLADVISKYYALTSESNLLVLHLFNYVELIIITLYFAKNEKSNSKRLIFIFSGIVAFLMLSNSIFWHEFDEFQVVGYFSLRLFIVLICLRELYLRYFENKAINTFIVTGLCFSSAIYLAIFSFGNVLAQFSFEEQYIIWYFNAAIFALAQVFYGLEVIVTQKWKLAR